MSTTGGRSSVVPRRYCWPLDNQFIRILHIVYKLRLSTIQLRKGVQSVRVRFPNPDPWRSFAWIRGRRWSVVGMVSNPVRRKRRGQ